jgi:CheY-like chemotaxis protein/anti-sigma regulatory factor (Ser/Thr protein kinase)
MNVLMIDDDPAITAQVAMLVRKHGWRPMVALRGRDGLERARSFRPDVILLSMLLPDIDGFEVCRLVRSDARTADLPVVMISSLDDSTYRRRGFRVGANAHLLKPFTAADLFAAIANAQHWRAGLDHAQVRAEVQVELDSETRYLLDVNEFLDALCAPTPLGQERAMRLRQAFLEIAQNAIEWGHAQLRDKPVRISFRAYDDRVEVVVCDQGPGYDPRNLPHAASPENPLGHLPIRERLGLRDGGFGLLIARGLVDELRINARGNLVTLVMRFASEPAEAEAPSDASARLLSP